MTDEKRPYRKRRRAESEAQTRLRITESAIELHGTLGPALTSISAVAEGAGVRRSTVYRHFPDEAALFAACSAHWMASNPPPDLIVWAGVDDPDERLALALPQLYEYYRRNAQMLANLHRDEATTPLVAQLFRGFHDYLAAARDALMEGRRSRPREKHVLAAAVGHAVAYSTWHSLTDEQGLDDTGAVELMRQLVASVSR